MVKAQVKTECVRELLLRRNLSQNNFARRIAVTCGYCSQLLRGERCPSPKVRQEILRELKAEFDEVFEIIASQTVTGGLHPVELKQAALVPPSDLHPGGAARA